MRGEVQVDPDLEELLNELPPHEVGFFFGTNAGNIGSKQVVLF